MAIQRALSQDGEWQCPEIHPPAGIMPLGVTDSTAKGGSGDEGQSQGYMGV